MAPSGARIDRKAPGHDPNLLDRHGHVDATLAPRWEIIALFASCLLSMRQVRFALFVGSILAMLMLFWLVTGGTYLRRQFLAGKTTNPKRKSMQHDPLQHENQCNTCVEISKNVENPWTTPIPKRKSMQHDLLQPENQCNTCSRCEKSMQTLFPQNEAYISMAGTFVQGKPIG